MTWAQNTTTKVWTNTGANRSVVVASAAFPGLSAVSLSVPAAAYNVKAVLFASLDGRSCYEAGIEGANIVVRRVAFGVVGSEVTNTASDTPAAGPCTVAHGLGAGVPFVMDVRSYEGRIEIRLNGSLVIRHTVDPADYLCVTNPYANQRYYGFASDVNGAVITKAQIAALVKSEPTPMTEVLVAVCDGNIVITEDAINAQTVGVGVFGNDGLVSLAAYQRKVWGVGTGFAKVFDPDPSGMTINDWAASAGSFPGSSGAGLTRMTMVENFLDRLALAGDPQDPQNAFLTAVGDATDFDTDADNEGRAFAFGTGLTGRIGQPITCIKQAANGVLVIGCTSQIWRLAGDPALGTPSLTPASLSSGLTGKDSATLANASTLLAHSPDGAFIVGSGPGEPAIPLSAAVLRTGIEIDRNTAGDYYQIVVRDAPRHVAYFFLTPKVSGTATHYVYDEQVGGYEPKAGGWFEDVYDPSIGPTAACMFRGMLVIGTRDGRLLFYDPDATSDDGDAFVSNAPLSLLDSKASNLDAIKVETTRVLLDDESDPIQLRVYRGRTPQEAMIGTGRSLAWSRQVSPYDGSIRQVASAPALSFEIYSNDADLGWSLESLEVDYSINANGARHGWKTPTAGRTTCTIHDDASDSTDDGPGEGSVPTPYFEPDPLFASQSAYDGDMSDPNIVLVQPPSGMTAFEATDSGGDGGVTDSNDGTVIDDF